MISDRWRMPSLNVAIDGRRNGYEGVLHFGRRADGTSVYGESRHDRSYRDRRGDRRGHRFGSHRYSRRSFGYYGYGHGSYLPIHHFGYRRHRPLLGYTYTSVYYTMPYVYHFEDVVGYEVVQVIEPTVVYDATLATPASPTETVEGPPSPELGYQPLTEPGDDTLIGLGNAAFSAENYDQARSFYISAVLADERDGYAKLLYALANFAARDYAVAGMAMQRALLTTPELIEYPADLRRLYKDESIFQRQLEDGERFIKEHPGDGLTAMLVGYLYYAGGDPHRALHFLDARAEHDGQDTLATLLRDAVVRVRNQSDKIRSGE